MQGEKNEKVGSSHFGSACRRTDQRLHLDRLIVGRGVSLALQQFLPKGRGNGLGTRHRIRRRYGGFSCRRIVWFSM